MKKAIFFLFIAVFSAVSAFSQSVEITNFMRLNPYSSNNNPAYFMPYKFHVGIPGVANVNFSVYNTGLIYKNLFTLDKDGRPLKITPDKFINSLPKNNWLNSELNLEILGFGLRVKRFFITFGYRLKFEERFRYSKDIFNLLAGNLAQDNKGNYIFTKESPAVLRMEPSLNLYQELSVGLQAQITDQLYVGLRPKVLFGVINLTTDNLYIKTYTDPEDYTIYGNYDVGLKVASVIPFYKKDEHGEIQFTTEEMLNIKAFNLSKNLGFGIDLGAVYRINQQLRVSASITDLGFIRWKGSPLSLTVKSPKKEYYEFSGFTETHIRNFIENGININVDSLVNNTFSRETGKPYTTALTSKIMVEGSFDVTPSNRFTVQLKGYVIGKQFLPQFTVAYNGTFFNLIDVVLSYSMMKKSFANLGLGLGFRLGPVHLYTGTDNVLAAINLLNAPRINATVGLVIDFPIKAKIKEPQIKSMYRAESVDDMEEVGGTGEKEKGEGRMQKAEVEKEPKVRKNKNNSEINE